MSGLELISGPMRSFEEKCPDDADTHTHRQGNSMTELAPLGGFSKNTQMSIYHISLGDIWKPIFLIIDIEIINGILI